VTDSRNGPAEARAAGIPAFAMEPLTKSEIAGTIRKVLDG
jgi:hypothetical protein